MNCDKRESDCMTCPLSIANNHKGLFCWEFAAKFPDEAARRMGYDLTEWGRRARAYEKETALH